MTAWPTNPCRVPQPSHKIRGDTTATVTSADPTGLLPRCRTHRRHLPLRTSLPPPSPMIANTPIVWRHTGDPSFLARRSCSTPPSLREGRSRPRRWPTSEVTRRRAGGGGRPAGRRCGQARVEARRNAMADGSKIIISEKKNTLHEKPIVMRFLWGFNRNPKPDHVTF